MESTDAAAAVDAASVTTALMVACVEENVDEVKKLLSAADKVTINTSPSPTLFTTLVNSQGLCIRAEWRSSCT